MCGARYIPGKLRKRSASLGTLWCQPPGQQKGFKNAYFVVDRSTHKGIGFSVWESKADVSALVESGFLPGAGCEIRSPIRRAP